MRFSDRQRHVVTLGARDAKFVIIPGPAQCGKTESAVPGFLHWGSRSFAGHEFGMFTKGKTQREAILVPRIRRFLSDAGVAAEWGDLYVDIPSYHGGMNRYYLLLSRESGSTQPETRVQGLTLSGAYIDEITNVSERLLNMLRTRFFTVPQAKLVGTCNPEGPSHPIKTEYIDAIERGDLDGEHIPFGLADNPILTRESIEEMARGFSGAWYDRMVLGKWAAAEGSIYPHFRVIATPNLPVSRWEVAIDFAPRGVTHAVLVGRVGASWHVFDELRYDGNERGHLPMDEQAQMFLRWAHPRSVSAWLIPEDGNELYRALANAGVAGQLLKPVQNVIWGINKTRAMLERMLTIDVGLAHLRRELGTYSWKETERDVPSKASADGAHGVDALRYWCATTWQVMTRETPA